MNYWRGYMDWPLGKDWACEVCGNVTLIWGLVHGVCRCDICHVQYTMRVDDEYVTRPVSLLKPQYRQAAIDGWAHFRKPISQWDDEMWDYAMSLEVK